MTEAAASSAGPAIAEPVARDFEYAVRLNVAIPLAWARALKTIGARHYDHACREMAECGVVNDLHIIATWNEDLERDSSWPMTHAVSWRDCDGMLKITEQGRDFDLGLIFDIRTWLLRTMDQIEARRREISAVPDEGGNGG